MRVIFEEVDLEYFFEIILSPEDLEQISLFGGVIKEFVWEGINIRDINIYIRKEKEKECHSLKEKKLALAKDSQKTSSEKCMKESPKSKPLQSLTQKLAAAKRKNTKKSR